MAVPNCLSSLSALFALPVSRSLYANGCLLRLRAPAKYQILADAPVELREISARLSTEYGVPYDSVWLNLSRDNNDSTPWHADKPCKQPERIVPVLSLGTTSRFLIRPKRGGRSTTFTVHGGDLIVVGGRCQQDYLHSVPKESRPSGARISINFSSKTQRARLAYDLRTQQLLDVGPGRMHKAKP